MHRQSNLSAAALAAVVASACSDASRAEFLDTSNGIGRITVGVPNAVTPVANLPQTTQLDTSFAFRLIATGANALENPSGVITKFGVLSTGVDTVPDIHTYLELGFNPGGPTLGYDYGRRFLFQGHENGGDLAYVTRINLDVTDPAHFITLLTPVNPATGKTAFNRIDGSSFNPFSNALLFSEEEDGPNSNGAGKILQLSLTWPPVTNTLEAFIGFGGFEGIHPDGKGNIYVVEDIGGARAPSGATATVDGTPNVPLKSARQPNSFVYRYLPANPRRPQDGGKLQAMQVLIDGAPLTFHANDVVGDIIAPAQKKLHTPGTTWSFRWVTVHESRAGDTTAFVATEAAKAAGATPFKRPENLAWLPDSRFRTFFFSVTGDTDAPTAQIPQLAARGAWGAIFRVDLDADDDRKQADSGGRISLFVLGDQDHASYDNLAFANHDQLLAAEDRGDRLHDQLQKYDSVWAYDVRDGSALRFIALGADAKAAPVGADDNEPTGVIVSNGGVSRGALVGTRESLVKARGFVTQQHGENNVYEVYRR